MRLLPKQEDAFGIVKQLPGKREDRCILSVDCQNTALCLGVAKVYEALACFPGGKHRFEKRFADLHKSGFDALGFLIVGGIQRYSAIRLDIPADIGPVLGGKWIFEGKRPGIRSVERDVDLIVSGKPKGEFNIAHLYAAFTWSKSGQRAASSCVWIVLRVCSLSVR